MHICHSQAAVFYREYSVDMWELKTSTQVLTFFAAILLGIMLCVFYDIFRAVRCYKKTSFVVTAVEDLFFWIVAALITFILLLAGTNGEVRFYVILGEVLGFGLSTISISKLTFKFFCWIVKIISMLFRKIYCIYVAFLKLVLGLYIDFLKILRKKAENMLKLRKKLLKSNRELLYTKTNN